MKLRSIVVDDSPVSRKSLQYLCGLHKSIDLMHVTSSAQEALQVFANEELDLLFLDIEMPGMSGLQLLDKMVKWPMVVFTTGKSDYAIDAFEYDAIDYLIKPISKSRFQKTISKVIKQHGRNTLAANSSAKKELYVRNAGRLIRVGYDQIQFFENKGDYILLHTDSHNVLFHGSLKSVEDHLFSPRFMRVHRSFLINLDKVVDIQDNSVLIGREVVPVSRSFKNTLLRSLNII